jgi:hypothetical protein
MSQNVMAIKPVPKPTMGKKAYPSRYPAPEAPKTVKAEKLVVAIVPSNIKPFSPLPARKYSSGVERHFVRARRPMRRTIKKYPAMTEILVIMHLYLPKKIRPPRKSGWP